MSKKKGKKAAAAPEQPATPSKPATGGGYVLSMDFAHALRGTSPFSFVVSTTAADRQPFRDRVVADLEAIHETLADLPPAPAECPPPPVEVRDTYAVAFERARRRCTHPRSVDTVYARRERQCMDCGRYFTEADS